MYSLHSKQLFQAIQASAVWVSVALRCFCDQARMFVARLWFLTHTRVRQGDHLGPRLFRRSNDARVAEWHTELDQHPWPQRLTCTCEPNTLPPSAVPLGTGGYADARRVLYITMLHRLKIGPCHHLLGSNHP